MNISEEMILAYQEIQDVSKQMENYLFSKDEQSADKLQTRINTIRMMLDIIESEINS